MKLFQRHLCAILLLVWSSAQPLAGPWRPASLPVTPKWGARFLALLSVGGTMGSVWMTRKLKAIAKEHQLIEKLHREVVREKDELSIAESTKQKGLSSDRMTRWRVGQVGCIGGAVVFGIGALCEMFNSWYWQPSRWRREYYHLRVDRGIDAKAQVWGRSWRKCQRIRGNKLYSHWPNIRWRGLDEQAFYDDLEALCAFGGFTIEAYEAWRAQYPEKRDQSVDEVIAGIKDYIRAEFCIKRKRDGSMNDSYREAQEHYLVARLVYIIDQLERPHVTKYLKRLAQENDDAEGADDTGQESPVKRADEDAPSSPPKPTAPAPPTTQTPPSAVSRAIAAAPPLPDWDVAAGRRSPKRSPKASSTTAPPPAHKINKSSRGAPRRTLSMGRALQVIGGLAVLYLTYQTITTTHAAVNGWLYLK